MKKIFINILLILSFAFSAHVSQELSLEVARNIFSKYHESRNLDNFSIKKIDLITDDESTLIYIYQLNPTGFIMVPADDKVTPVLAYGFDSNFKLENMPGNLTDVVNAYKQDIIELKSMNQERSIEVQEEWNNILSDNNNDDDNNQTRNVSPLIDAEFDQSGSWNNTLTAETGFNGPLGCVAISMGQIMHYWGYPEQGEGSNSYLEDDLGMLEVDFGQSFYDFDNMAATYATNPSRLLLYHCGVAVNMDYEYGGSGAQCEGVYPSAEYAMKTYFKYGNSIQSIDGDNYSVTEFRNILKNELDQSKPILFSGFSDSYGNGGHAWNVDGYQGNNLHCNWGWGGYNNGYFSLPSLGGFDTWQNALINIIPESYENPLALFEYDINDMTVTLIDLSEFVNESEVETWSWNFGDGNTETNTYSFAEHTYSSPGEYQISLSITSIYGQVSEPHIEVITIGNPGLPGDVNSDDILNVLDVVMIVNFILGEDNPSNSEFNASDYNSDGMLNVQDLVLIINDILN